MEATYWSVTKDVVVLVVIAMILGWIWKPLLIPGLVLVLVLSIHDFAVVFSHRNTIRKAVG